MSGADASGVELADARYTLRSRLEILSLLYAVAERRAAVTIHFPGGAGFIVSSLLHVNPQFEELVFDVGADPDANSRLLGSSRMTLVMWLDGVKLQFPAQSAEPTSYQGLPALRIRVPAEMLRLQRREYFRARIPLASPLHARLPLPEGEAKARVLDISVGGVAIVMPEHAPLLPIGTLLRPCRMELPDYGELVAGLEIRNDMATAERAAKAHRYGCRFMNLPRQAIAAIQRFIMKLERERARSERR
jgi:c-di-GMP-binding flagellar brake protein YcgR